MSFVDERFSKRERKLRRNYEIEDSLYKGLEKITLTYDASVTDLINAAIEYLVKTGNVYIYGKKEEETLVPHTLLIKESNLDGLDSLKEKYGVSIYKLVNIAIKNLIDEM